MSAKTNNGAARAEFMKTRAIKAPQRRADRLETLAVGAAKIDAIAAERNKAAAPIAVTSVTSFFSIGDGGLLFSVRPGVCAEVAREQASCFLSAARDAAYDATDRNTNAYTAGVMIEMAKALVDAIEFPDAMSKGGQS